MPLLPFSTGLPIPVPIKFGGTGSATQNFVDLSSTTQTKVGGLILSPQASTAGLTVTSGSNTDNAVVANSGSLLVQDNAATPTKQYRFRTNGGAMDFEGAGNSIYFSVWQNAGFGGTQHNYWRGENGGTFDAANTWLWRQNNDLGGTVAFELDPGQIAIYPGTNHTGSIGIDTNYWQYGKISRLYLNSTAYLDGGTAGNVNLTGSTAGTTALNVNGTGGGTLDYTILQLSGNNPGFKVQFNVANTATAATTNAASFNLQAQTSSGQRTVFQFISNFSNITDATRTSQTGLWGANNGTFSQIVSFAGVDTTFYGNVTITDAKNIILGTTTGTQLATSSTQKLGHWGAVPIIQPTTAITGATYVSGAGTALTTLDTFDGYTLAQVVKALRNEGLLA